MSQKTKKKTIRTYVLVSVEVEYLEEDDGTVKLVDYGDAQVVGFEGIADGLADSLGTQVFLDG